MQSSLPILKPRSWVNDRGLAAVAQELTGFTQDISLAPVVVYVKDCGTHYGYFDSPDQLSRLKKDGLENLRKRLEHHFWEVIEACQENIHLQYLAFVEHELAAECLLLPERLIEAQTLLQCDALYACVPARGILLVYPASEQNNALRDVFVGVCRENYQQAAENALSPLLWHLKNGKITGCDSPEVLTIEDKCRLTDRDGTLKPNRIFLVHQIVFVSLFGTLLAGFYALWHNYRVLGKYKLSKVTAVFAFVLIPIVTLLFLNLPGNSFDRFLPIFSAITIGGIAWYFQGDLLRTALAKGFQRKRIKAQVAVILVSLLAMFPFVALMLWFL